MTASHIAAPAETDDAYVLPISGLVLVSSPQRTMTEVRTPEGATLALVSGIVDVQPDLELGSCPGPLLAGSWTSEYHRGQPSAWAVALGTLPEDGDLPKVSFLRRTKPDSALLHRQAIQTRPAGDLWIAEARGAFAAVYAADGLERYGRRFSPARAAEPLPRAS